MSPQQEKTNNRPSNYSKWHRHPNLPEWCYQVDGDYFELRKREDSKVIAVAYIETIQVPPLFMQNPQQDYPLWRAKEALLNEISERMNIPCYVVRHKPSCDLFFVARFINGYETEEKMMKSNEYKDFLMKLGVDRYERYGNK